MPSPATANNPSRTKIASLWNALGLFEHAFNKQVTKNAELEAKNAELEVKVAELEAKVTELKGKNSKLWARLQRRFRK